MIFVTVGTTLPFDALVQAVDALVAGQVITDPVVCQIGHGDYLPQHCEHFRFQPNIDEYIAQASLVIGHGGTGTVTGLLASGKPFVAVANPLGADNHQAQFLERLAHLAPFLWTADLARLPALIAQAPHFVSNRQANEHLATDLSDFLRGRDV